jgi:ADP-ribose pyrophosphatase YjhB (NUDIX family)
MIATVRDQWHSAAAPARSDRCPYAPGMTASVRLKRLSYQCAYVLLRIYWLLARPRVSGVKCVITAGPEVLLVRHTYGSRRWNLPGGAVKRGESPRDAAAREMAEELGIASVPWSALGTVRVQQHGRRDTLHCFAAELDDHRLTIDQVEIAAARWFPRDELPPRLGRYVRRIVALTAGA